MGGRFTAPSHLCVRLKARCRKCEHCLKVRRNLWAERAIQEHRENSNRSWFGTVLFGPNERPAILAAAIIAARKAGLDYDGLTEAEQFEYLKNACSPYVTRWLKRVRKRSADRYSKLRRKLRKAGDPRASDVPRGAKLRYMLVIEPHEDNFPHVHFLAHECRESGGRLTYRDLHNTWGHGFTHVRLIQDEYKGVTDRGERACRYVAKYLTKASWSRVRASRLYGDGLKPKLGAVDPSVDKATPFKNQERSETEALKGKPYHEQLSKLAADPPPQSGAARLSTAASTEALAEGAHWFEKHCGSWWRGAHVTYDGPRRSTDRRASSPGLLGVGRGGPPPRHSISACRGVSPDSGSVDQI